MNLNRRHFMGSAAAMLAAGLAACGGDDDPLSGSARTTLLVYMLGSNLESGDGAATGNLQEMMAAHGSALINVVLTTGGADKVDPNGFVKSWKTVKRHELKDGELKELADVGVQNMDLGQTLQAFLEWGVTAYPADRYMLMMWDHGAGWLGFGSDENFPRSGAPSNPGCMSLPSLVGALKGAQASTGVTFDYIGFDACLMATLEVAAAVRPYTRYLGASQELEAGSGWDWRTIVQTLTDQPDIAPAAFGDAAAAAFLNKQLTASSGNPNQIIGSPGMYATFSVIDTAKVPTVLQRLGEWAQVVMADYDAAQGKQRALRQSKAGRGESPFAQDAGEAYWSPVFGARVPSERRRDNDDPQAPALDPYTELWLKIARGRALTQSFGRESFSMGNGPMKFDLCDLAHLAQVLAADGIGATAYAALREAVLNAVAHNHTGPGVRAASGLSIYFPRYMNQTEFVLSQSYEPLDLVPPYRALIRRHATVPGDDPKALVTVGPIEVSSTNPRLLQSQVVSQFGAEDIDLMLVEPVAGSSRVARIVGSTPRLRLVEGWDSNYGFGGLAVFDTSHWLLLDGQPAIVFTVARHMGVEQGVQYLAAVDLAVPVRLSRADGSEPEEVMLVFQAELDEENNLEIELVGIQDINDDDEALSPRLDSDLHVGDTVEPMHLYYDLERGEPLVEPDGSLRRAFGAPIRVTEQTGLREGALASGPHALAIALTDLNDGLTFSPVLSYQAP